MITENSINKTEPAEEYSISIKDLEIITSELLSTLNMEESLNISIDTFNKISEAYNLTKAEISQLGGLNKFIVKYFINYFNSTKDTSVNDLFVYSSIIYVLNDYIQASIWRPQVDSKELLSIYKENED